MKGIAQLIDNEVMTMPSEVKKTASGQPLMEKAVRECLQNYFAELDGEAPTALYRKIIALVEKPLWEWVLDRTHGNQSQAANMLQISRGTFRKKMAEYGLLD